MPSHAEVRPKASTHIILCDPDSAAARSQGLMAMARRSGRAGATREPTPDAWVIEVDRWDYSFHFGPNGDRHADEVWSQTLTLEAEGAVLRPEKPLRPRTALTVYARWGMMAERERAPLPGVGIYDVKPDLLDATVWVPDERFAELSCLAGSGRLRFAVLYLTQPRYRRGRVVNLSVHTALDPEDY